MMTIRLTRGLECIVDDSDFECLSAYKWYAGPARNNMFYASRTITEAGRRIGVKMHRQLMGFPDGFVDHINRNPLDNRRANLRTATQLQNNVNSSLAKNNTTGFKGVSYARHGNKYRYSAHIRLSGTLKHLGHYQNAVDAAIAYNNAAIEHFGEFAGLNALPAAPAA